MRVISPSFEILTELDKSSMASRIEICGRVCYKSEEKITADSAEPFIKNVLKRKHNSVAEMAVLSIEIAIDQQSYIGHFFEVIPRYFAIDSVDKKVLMITGSVRAFRELFIDNPAVKVVKGITAFLGNRYPLFFDDLKPKSGWMPQTGIKIRKMPLAEVDSLPVAQLAKHRFIAVKFITNRAVTHEIVRHRPCSFLQESQRYCRYDKNQFGNEVTFIKPLFFEDGSPEYAIWEKAMQDTEAMYLELLKTSSPQAARTILPNSCKTEIVVYASLAEWSHIFMQRTSPAAEPSMRELMIPLLAEFKGIFPTVFAEVMSAVRP